MKIQDHIRSCLSALEPRNLSSGYIREAAVLMPIFEWHREHYFLLTLRTEEVQTHKGQVSFPGGMREGNEDLHQTALRETLEEIGIEEGRIETLGRFHDYLSINGYRVTPFAGFIAEPFTIKPQTTEVAEVLQVPFQVFLDPSCLRVERSKRLGTEAELYFYSFGIYEIWGLTARIIRDFFEVLDLENHAPGRNVAM